MNKKNLWSIFGGICLVCLCASAVTVCPVESCKSGAHDMNNSLTNDPAHVSALAEGVDSTRSTIDSSTQIPTGAQILIDVYPDHVKGFKDGSIVLSDGSLMIYDDERKKSFVEKLDDADLEDMFAFTYDRSSWTPGFQQDAGRSRCEAFFKKMYGASEAQVRKNLVSVQWFGQKVLFTKVNHAADSLRAVAAELAKYPELKRYLYSSGSFYWRKVRGANRQSAHSYGMTIDIAVKYSDYWLWKNPGKKETDKIIYANRIPHKLVEIFEKHGFIWGGRWYHYDTMHFEFRPEILKANP